jgi:mono/diheme cytochrome c family protein
MTPRSKCVIALIVAVVTACGSAHRDEPVTPPFIAANEMVAQGEAVFKQHCDYCHPGGAAGLGPALNNKPAPRFAIRYQVRHGLGAMPAFDGSELTDAQVRSVAEYLRALRGHR